MGFLEIYNTLLPPLNIVFIAIAPTTVSEEVHFLCRFASTHRKDEHNARVEWNHTRT